MHQEENANPAHLELLTAAEHTRHRLPIHTAIHTAN
jgi:hypothetical protein